MVYEYKQEHALTKILQLHILQDTSMKIMALPWHISKKDITFLYIKIPCYYHLIPSLNHGTANGYQYWLENSIIYRFNNRLLLLKPRKYTKSRLNRSYLDNVHDDTGCHHPQSAQQIRQKDLRSDGIWALRQETMRRTSELAGETSEPLPLITELQL